MHGKRECSPISPRMMMMVRSLLESQGDKAMCARALKVPDEQMPSPSL